MADQTADRTTELERRVQDLLEANNRYLERARVAERERDDALTRVSRPLDRDLAALVASLRDEVIRLSGRSLDRGCVDSGLSAALADQAADTIESLSARLSAVKRERDEARETGYGVSAQLEHAEFHRAAAEARIAKLEAGLTAIDDLLSSEIKERFGGHPSLSEEEAGKHSKLYSLLEIPRRIARAALEGQP